LFLVRVGTKRENHTRCGAHPARRCRRSGRLIRQLSQFSNYEGEESPVEDRGFELDKCSRSKRASLDSIAASRAFSLLSCFILCSCCITRCS
jgi:hypothetical protein